MPSKPSQRFDEILAKRDADDRAAVERLQACSLIAMPRRPGVLEKPRPQRRIR